VPVGEDNGKGSESVMSVGKGDSYNESSKSGGGGEGNEGDDNAMPVCVDENIVLGAGYFTARSSTLPSKVSYRIVNLFIKI
jgi:hypothetical protein